MGPLWKSYELRVIKQMHCAIRRAVRPRQQLCARWVSGRRAVSEERPFRLSAERPLFLPSVCAGITEALSGSYFDYSVRTTVTTKGPSKCSHAAASICAWERNCLAPQASAE